MSVHLIHKYYFEVEKMIRFGGSAKETAVRNAFYNLLNEYARQKDLLLVPELDYKVTSTGKTVRPDGTLKDAIRLDWGYWESKDTSDDLDKEIEKKFRLGYPKSNILFEDSKTAILYQEGKEVGRVPVNDAEKLDRLLNEFTSYVRPEVKSFREALEVFKKDVPQVLETLRELIEKQSAENPKFKQAQADFLALCRETINPEVSPADVNEMLMQHILTEEIFTSVFEDPQFHQENNISKELHKLEDTFFTGSVKRTTLEKIKTYYAAIKAQAGNIVNYSEKQMFLKSIYENFYKVYNPKAADRLGVVYTPNEIVKFMIEGTDYLLHKHFGKTLSSRNVEILDPATGTGTFIVDIIDYLPQAELPYKYKNEIHCNEVAILPYYIANLNIEATYKQKTGQYEEFKNICFVDTLDNLGFEFVGKQTSLFSFSAENAERVKRQNEKKISVIIGNPPYNAKQENYNYQNANRAYKGIDQRIKDTYIRYGTAQNQIVVYDMYTRFYRWAMDRLDNNGVIAFITNRSFIDSRAYDGFRKVVEDNFSHAYILDTRSDVRMNPKIAGTTHNVFGIQAGVAIMLLLKKENKEGNCRIAYYTLADEQRKEEKLQWINENPLSTIAFEQIIPDKKHNWINQSDNDFDSLLPLVDKEAKAGRNEKTIFKLFSSGLKSQRDEWVYDFSKHAVEAKMKFFVEIYQKSLEERSNNTFDSTIKWDEDLRSYLKRGIEKPFKKKSIIKSDYRPFVTEYLYFDKHFNGRTYQWFNIKPSADKNNISICISGIGSSKNFQSLASNAIVCLDFLEKTQCLPLYRYDKDGNRIVNITDWGLQQFREHYKDDSISKEDIFHYTYAVLHNPAYRKKYELNLKREFPRLPYYDNFHQWAAWGKQLMELHINFETAEPYPLKLVDLSQQKAQPKQAKLLSVAAKAGHQLLEEPALDYYTPKAKLKADKENGVIILDEATELTGVPSTAWEYKLGNRSALEWILDQYKEKKPSDPTIAEKFNTYRFADYKNKVIDLLKRVTMVSVETMKIVNEMNL